MYPVLCLFQATRWRGERLAQALAVGSLLEATWPPPGSIFICFYVLCIFCHLDSWKRDPSLVAPPDVSSIFSVIKVYFGKVLLIHCESLRTESVVCCTDCKAPWGKFVILGYTNKHWLESILLLWKTIHYRIVSVKLGGIMYLQCCDLYSWPLHSEPKKLTQSASICHRCCQTATVKSLMLQINDLQV